MRPDVKVMQGIRVKGRGMTFILCLPPGSVLVCPIALDPYGNSEMLLLLLLFTG